MFFWAIVIYYVIMGSSAFGVFVLAKRDDSEKHEYFIQKCAVYFYSLFYSVEICLLVNDKHDVLSDMGVFGHVLTDKVKVPELFRWKVAYPYVKVISL